MQLEQLERPWTPLQTSSHRDFHAATSTTQHYTMQGNIIQYMYMDFPTLTHTHVYSVCVCETCHTRYYVLLLLFFFRERIKITKEPSYLCRNT